MLFHKIKFHDDKGSLTAIAQIVRNPMSAGPDELIFGSDRCRQVINGLRQLPLGSVIVSMYYPIIDRQVILNKDPIKESNVDLTHIFASQEENKKEAYPIRLVAPEPIVVPVDEIVEYAVVETIQDILNTDAHKVLLFAEDKLELLECLVEYSNLFKITPMVLSGLPGAEYSAQFEGKTYTLERVSYASLVNDLIERQRVSAALAAEGRTAYDKEKAQYTRTSGHVKELSGVAVAGTPTENEPAEPGDD